MAFPDPRDPRTESHTENVQDVIPPTERNQDPEITQITHGLTAETTRPLTDEERKAADRDAPVGQRVYAPASERVPVNPVPRRLAATADDRFAATVAARVLVLEAATGRLVERRRRWFGRRLG